MIFSKETGGKSRRGKIINKPLQITDEGKIGVSGN